MDGLMFLIPAAIALGGIALLGFIWAVKSGQFDDLEGDANRILFDDEPKQPNRKNGPHVKGE